MPIRLCDVHTLKLRNRAIRNNPWEVVGLVRRSRPGDPEQEGRGMDQGTCPSDPVPLIRGTCPSDPQSPFGGRKIKVFITF